MTAVDDGSSKLELVQHALFEVSFCLLMADMAELKQASAALHAIGCCAGSHGD